MSHPPLALLLLRASRWFDRQLLDGLQAAGWPRLTPAQSLLFAHLDPQGVPPATLARRLGTTRQGTQELVAGLVRHNLLTLQDDPARRRGRLVVLTARGQALTAHARQLLDQLETSLGHEPVNRLRALLTDPAQLAVLGDPANLVAPVDHTGQVEPAEPAVRAAVAATNSPGPTEPARPADPLAGRRQASARSVGLPPGPVAVTTGPHGTGGPRTLGLERAR